MSACCKTVMYHSLGESHKAAAPLIKARFLTSIVGDQAECYGDVPSTVLQPPRGSDTTQKSRVRFRISSFFLQ